MRRPFPRYITADHNGQEVRARIVDHTRRAVLWTGGRWVNGRVWLKGATEAFGWGFALEGERRA